MATIEDSLLFISYLYFRENTGVITSTQILSSAVKSYNIDIDIGINH